MCATHAGWGKSNASCKTLTTSRAPTHAAFERRLTSNSLNGKTRARPVSVTLIRRPAGLAAFNGCLLPARQLPPSPDTDEGCLKAPGADGRTLRLGSLCRPTSAGVSLVNLTKDSRATSNHAVMLAMLKAFLRNDSGATAIEYSIIAGGIALAILATVMGIGPKLNTTFSSISSQLK
jgi:pilus assembly protein Flp/PilA